MSATLFGRNDGIYDNVPWVAWSGDDFAKREVYQRYIQCESRVGEDFLRATAPWDMRQVTLEPILIAVVMTSSGP